MGAPVGFTAGKGSGVAVSEKGHAHSVFSDGGIGAASAGRSRHESPSEPHPKRPESRAASRAAVSSARWLAAGGRNSLLIYMIHQPILFTAIVGIAWLGAGGMGIVYRAVQSKLNRLVALNNSVRFPLWYSKVQCYVKEQAQ